MPRNFRTIATTIVITLVIILVLQNIRAISLRFIVWDLTMPSALLVILTFAAGAATGWFWRRR